MSITIRFDTEQYASDTYVQLQKFCERQYPSLHYWLFVHPTQFLLKTTDRHCIIVKLLKEMYRHEKIKKYVLPFDQTLLFSIRELVGDEFSVGVFPVIEFANTTKKICSKNQYMQMVARYDQTFDKQWISNQWASKPLKNFVVLSKLIYLLNTLKSDFVDSNAKTLCMNPISITRDALTQMFLQFDGDYIVAPKVDGERALLYVTDGEIYTINRTFSEPVLIGKCDEWSIWNDSIFDIEIINGAGSDIGNNYCLLDVLCIQSIAMVELTFDRRLRELQSFRKSLRFVSEQKMFLQTYLTIDEWLIDTDQYNDPDKYDGLILIYRKSLYDISTTSNKYFLLKWKPAHLNTIDFEIISPMRLGITGDSVSGSDYVMTFAVSENCIGRIGEFKLNQSDNHTWELVRLRDDKVRSNARWVIERVLESIRDAISLVELRTYCEEHLSGSANTKQQSSMIISNNQKHRSVCI